MSTNSSPNRVLVAWGLASARLYCTLRGWNTESVTFVEDYQGLRDIPEGSEVTVLGPHKLYEPGVYTGIIWTLDVLGNRVTIHDDTIDRLLGLQR